MNKGRPNQEDIELAERFALNLKRKGLYEELMEMDNCRISFVLKGRKI